MIHWDQNVNDTNTLSLERRSKTRKEQQKLMGEEVTGKGHRVQDFGLVWFDLAFCFFLVTPYHCPRLLTVGPSEVSTVGTTMSLLWLTVSAAS